MALSRQQCNWKSDKSESKIWATLEGGRLSEDGNSSSSADDCREKQGTSDSEVDPAVSIRSREVEYARTSWRETGRSQPVSVHIASRPEPELEAVTSSQYDTADSTVRLRRVVSYHLGLKWHKVSTEELALNLKNSMCLFVLSVCFLSIFLF